MVVRVVSNGGGKRRRIRRTVVQGIVVPKLVSYDGVWANGNVEVGGPQALPVLHQLDQVRRQGLLLTCHPNGLPRQPQLNYLF